MTEVDAPVKLAEQPVDEFLWLEDIHGDDAMAWVRERNARTDAALVNAAYSDLEASVLEVLDSADRIPMVSKRGGWYYNFWRDAENPRGLWRRTTWASYLSPSPKWDVLLDIDALCASTGEEWFWAGASLLRPSPGEEYRHMMVALSPDGGDAVAYREFDLSTLSFVEGGFELPSAKTRLGWLDVDTLYVGTDTGVGSMTESSYPAATRVLRRGETLEQLAAKEPLFSVPLDHLSGGVSHSSTPGFERDVAYDVLDFFNSRSYLRVGEEWVHIEVPDDMSVSLHHQWLLLRPRTDWIVAGTVYAAGTLLVIEVDAFMAGSRELRTVFAPTAAQSLQSWSWTKDFLLLNLLSDVSSKILVLDPASGWAATELDACPPLHSVDAYAVDDEDVDPDNTNAGNDYWLVATGFLTPSTIYRGTLFGSGTHGGAAEGAAAALVREAPSFFNAENYSVEQHFATSSDGTRVPYFQVGHKDLVLDGANPTLLSGYGGFEVSRTPAYSGTVGRSWLERGGVFVVANIRGGGEYGPTWHTAALQENRHRAYDDFAAVARDLSARKVTSASRLGCAGGSNGGLLVGNMLTHYPDLFGAVSCGVPLLDMRRYTKLSAGASWIAEYGDPDVPEQWEFIKTFSPYHLLRAGVQYPATFIWTATSDDRVGPVQARKMAARMESMGIPVWFHEALEGGHSGAGNNEQAARLHTASHEFLWRALNGQL